jgi:nitroreductase
LKSLPQVKVATDEKVFAFIEAQRFSGIGIGFVDAHPGTRRSPLERSTNELRGVDDMESDSTQALAALLQRRFGDDVETPQEVGGIDGLLRIASHASHRAWSADPVPQSLVRLLGACALSSPSKSDLQQAAVIDVRDPGKKAAIAALVPQLPWVGAAPAFVVFCGDGSRLRRIFERRGQPFPNEHLDQFFNATVDASITMTSFMHAASAAGLVFCAISLIRDRVWQLDELLGLPDHVFPVAGLCVGYPASAGRIRPRLPLGLTLHVDRYDGASMDRLLDEYDDRCIAARRDGAQAAKDTNPPFAGWTQEKFAQYSVPLRADWGDYVASKKFQLR